MNYYKVIVNAEIVGVATSQDCVRFQTKHSMLERALDNQAEYIECSRRFYHAQWMQPIKTNIYHYTVAEVISIGEQEYNILVPAVETAPIPIVDDDDNDEAEIINNVDPIEEMTLEYVRTSKLNAMSTTCRTTIESGFDLELRGETRHFSLTTQDQLNLMSLSTFAQTQELIPYHADGEECEFYTPEEINQIITTATEFKNYQIAYFNSLKVYINTLDTIETIAAITYGTPIPDEYKSDVLRVLE